MTPETQSNDLDLRIVFAKLRGTMVSSLPITSVELGYTVYHPRFGVGCVLETARSYVQVKYHETYTFGYQHPLQTYGLLYIGDLPDP